MVVDYPKNKMIPPVPSVIHGEVVEFVEKRHVPERAPESTTGLTTLMPSYRDSSLCCSQTFLRVTQKRD